MRVSFSQHPEYVLKKPKWEMYRDLYEGDHDTLVQARYLAMHELERTGTPEASLKRVTREERSQYTEILESVVSRYVSLFFKKDPDTSQVDDLFGEYKNDVDGKGRNLVSFLKEKVLLNLFLYGKPIVLVEGPPRPKEGLSVKEQKDQKLRPYFCSICPMEMPDWSMNDKGDLSFFRTEEWRLEPRTDPGEKPVLRKYSKAYVLTKDGIEARTYKGPTKDLEKKEGQKPPQDEAWSISSTVSLPNWDEIPLVMLKDEEAQQSWVKGVAPLCLRFFNLESTLDNILYFQCHQRIFIIGDLDNSEKLKLREYTVTFLPTGSTIDTIEPVSPTSHFQRLQDTYVLIGRVAFNQSRSLPTDAKSVEAADTIRASKEDFLELVLATITDMENFTNEMVRLYAKFNGDDSFEGKVTFDKSLTVEDVDAIRNDYMTYLSDIQKVPRWHKAILQKVVENENLADAEEIKKDIETTDFRPVTVNPLGGQVGSIRNNILTAYGGQEGSDTGANGPGGQGAGPGNPGVPRPAGPVSPKQPSKAP